MTVTLRTRGDKRVQNCKMRVHVYPGTGTSGTMGNKRLLSAGTHVPLRRTLETGTLPFFGGSSLSCAPSFSFSFLDFLPFHSEAGSGSFGFFFGASTDYSACRVS